MGVKTLSLLTLCLIFRFALFSTIEDLKCNHGSMNPSKLTECRCTAGWGGFSCSMCKTDLACTRDEVEDDDDDVEPKLLYCDTNFFPGPGKLYECSVDDEDFVYIIGETVILGMDFGGVGFMEIWGIQRVSKGVDDIYDLHERYLKTAGCTIFNVSSDYDFGARTISIESSSSLCSCGVGSTKCEDEYVASTIAGMVGASHLTCNVYTEECVMKHDNFIGEVKLKCKASGCLEEPIPEPSNFTYIPAILILSWKGYVVDGLCLVFVIMLCLVLPLACCLNNILYSYTSEKRDSEIIMGINHFEIRAQIESYSCGKLIILKPIFIKFGGGVTGLIGPSGAGKTTLLNITAGHIMKGYFGNKRGGGISIRKCFGVIGRTAINCLVGCISCSSHCGLDELMKIRDRARRRGLRLLYNEVDTEHVNLSRIRAFQEQDVLLTDSATVMEVIRGASNARDPRNRKERNMWISKIIGKLGLSAHVDRRIGSSEDRGLSGGEKSRVMLASQLAGFQPFTLLDEPLSGLDGETKLSVLQLLKKKCRENHVTVLSLHDPNDDMIMYLDNVVFMQSGEVVFNLTLSQLIHMSKKYRKSDSGGTPMTYAQILERHYKELANNVPAVSTLTFEDDLENVEKLMERNITESKNLIPTQIDVSTKRGDDDDDVLDKIRIERRPTEIRKLNPTKNTLLRQVTFLLIRDIRSIFRNLFSHIIRALIPVLISVVISVLYYKLENGVTGSQNRMGFIYFLCLYLNLASITSLWLFSDDKLLYLNEVFTGTYTKHGWFVGKLIVRTVMNSLYQPILISLITYWIIGLHKGRFFQFLFITISASILSDLQVIIIGIISSKNTGIMLYVVISLLNTLSSGLVLNFNTIPAIFRWAGYFFGFWRVVYEALMINEFEGSIVRIDPKGLTGVKPFNAPGEFWLVELGMNVENLDFNLVMLVVMPVVYTLVAHGLFLYKMRIKK